MLRRLTLFSFVVVRTDPIALLRLESASATPRVILAQSSRAAILSFTERQCSVGSDYVCASGRRHQFEEHCTVLSSWRAPVLPLYHRREEFCSCEICSSYSYAFSLMRETKILTI